MPSRYINVPQYYNKYIDSKVDLDETPKVCCPFHKEDTPSFSYNQATGRWRCFGACKKGGDVIELHRANYRLKTRQEAEDSLLNLLGIKKRKIENLSELKPDVVLNEENIEIDRLYTTCLLHANCVERWLDMDLAMSYYPVDKFRLEALLKKWGVQY